MAEQVPSEGRIVHFVYGDRHYAAIITDPYHYPPGQYESDGQALTVFPPGDAPFSTIAVFDAAGAPATWHWPEYVPAKD